jgi:hypothetical protein
MFQQHVLGLEVAVDDAVMTHQAERQQHLVGEAADKGRREADEAVRLDELVQIHAEELHRDTQMSAEGEVLDHLDDLVLVLRVLVDHSQHKG